MSSEEINKEMPVNRDYDARISNEVFVPDADIPEGETDPFDVGDATNKSNNEDRVMDRNSTNEVGSTGAYEELTATLDPAFKKKKGIFQDRGEKLVEMNVEGMPWFHDEVDEEEQQMRKSVPELNGRETRRVIASSLLAALMIAGVFIFAMFLFILFCTKVWF